MINKGKLTLLALFFPYAEMSEQNATVPREPHSSLSSLSFSLLLRGNGICRTRSQHLMSEHPALRITSDRPARIHSYSPPCLTSVKVGCNKINSYQKNILYVRKYQFWKISHREIWVNMLLHSGKQNLCFPPNREGDRYFVQKILELLPVWADRICTLLTVVYHIDLH